jgi:hypothetical protein
LWAARRQCGVNLREGGEQAGGMDYAAVCGAIGRLGQRARTDRLLRRAMSRLESDARVEH